MAQQVKFDTIRSLAFGSISGTYAAVGTATTVAARLICITNTCDTDMFFSIDGVHDMLIVAHGGFKLFDLQTNRLNVDQQFLLPINTQFYVKQVTAPGSGTVYIEVVYGA
jgi:hypothetical protein